MQISTATPGKTRIGWIGTGVMGRWMCEHAMKKGFSATVYNRSADKAQPLVDQGAKLAEDSKAVAEQSDIVFAIVGFPKGRAGSVFGCGRGGTAGEKPGTVLVDMTTSDPSLAKEIYEASKAKGVASLDAPVSGGDVGAKNAAALHHDRRRQEVVAAVQPVFECMGKTIVHQGCSGFRSAHEDGEPDSDFVEHDRGV